MNSNKRDVLNNLIGALLVLGIIAIIAKCNVERTESLLKYKKEVSSEESK